MKITVNRKILKKLLLEKIKKINAYIENLIFKNFKLIKKKSETS